MTDLTTDSRLQAAPNLAQVAQWIGKKSPFQKKSVSRYLESADGQFLEFAEDWISRLLQAQGGDDGHERLAESYVKYTKMVRVEEMHFGKSGEYRQPDYDDVYQEIYSQDDHMRGYVTGLGMTQVFWPNHYQIVRFYLDRFIPLIADAKRGAEIGVGHGFFHSEMLRGAPNATSQMLDVSPVALDFTHKIIEATGVDRSRATQQLCDVQKEIPVPDGSLDVLLMGEVIEHLGQAEEVQTTMAKKMAENGVCFFTTAANARAEDHLLLFRTTGEIRSFLKDCGWEPIDEQLGTLNEMSLEEAEADGHNINYAAVLKPRA